jgi:hypothetical protein
LTASRFHSQLLPFAAPLQRVVPLRALRAVLRAPSPVPLKVPGRDDVLYTDLAS